MGCARSQDNSCCLARWIPWSIRLHIHLFKIKLVFWPVQLLNFFFQERLCEVTFDHWHVECRDARGTNTAKGNAWGPHKHPPAAFAPVLPKRDQIWAVTTPLQKIQANLGRHFAALGALLLSLPNAITQLCPHLSASGPCCSDMASQLFRAVGSCFSTGFLGDSAEMG